MKTTMLRKAAVGILAVALVVPAAAAAAQGKAKKQEVTGKIALGITHPQDTTSCYAGIHRRIALLSGERVNGDVGYHFDLDPATAGKNFVLEVVEGMGSVDLDIIFYHSGFGTPDQVVTDPLGAGAPATVGFENSGAGGEAGKVPPKEYTKAIVCIKNGDPAALGANATFSYTAGKGVKLPK